MIAQNNISYKRTSTLANIFNSKRITVVSNVQNTYYSKNKPRKVGPPPPKKKKKKERKKESEEERTVSIYTHEKSTGCMRGRERVKGKKWGGGERERERERERASFSFQLHVNCYLSLFICGRSRCVHLHLHNKMTVQSKSTSLLDEIMHSGK